jgi:hypothetical protein
MSLLGFPSSPSVGQTYTTVSGTTYVWNGQVWSIVNQGTQSSTNVISGDLVVTGSTGTVGGAVIITTATIYQYISQANTSSQLSILAGTDTAVSIIGHTATIWNTSTLESITGRGNTTDHPIIIINTSDAVSTNTGALQVVGGVGIGEDVVIGGNLTVDGIEFINNPVDSTSTTSGALVVEGGVGIGGDIWLGGNLYITGHQALTTSSFYDIVASGPDILITATVIAPDVLTISDISTLESVTGRGAITDHPITLTNSLNSTLTNVGALTVTGGVGVGGNVNAGGNVSTNGAFMLTYGDFASTSTIINTTSTTVVDLYPVTSYRTAKYIAQIQAGAGYGALFEAIEILLLVDNLQNVYSTEYSRVGPISLGDFSADVELDGNVRLYFTPSTTATVTLKLMRITVGT